MPFNGSGDFSRVHNWQQDRDNGIKILALRMDQEFDNFQGGMNLTFLRNGLVPMTANLNLGTNYIIGLGSGSVGALPIRFADDPNTGLFLNGYNKLGLVSNGILRLEANTSGVATNGNATVSGTFNSIGAITQNGQQVWHAGNLSSPAITNGSNTFTGSNTFQSSVTIEESTIPGRLAYLRTGILNWYTGGYTGGGNNFGIQLNANTPAMAIDTSGNTTLLATTVSSLDSGGAIRQSGNQVWHAGNFNPAQYALLTANPVVFTGGAVRVRSSANGIVELVTGTATDTGYIQFRTPGDIANGYIGFVSTGGPINYAAQGGGGHAFSGGPVGITGTLNATGAITQNGQQVWHAGNLSSPAITNGSNTFTGASNTFTGTVTAAILNVDANFGQYLSSGNPLMQYDASDYSSYDRTNNVLSHSIGDVAIGQWRTTGLTVAGEITRSGQGNFIRHNTSGRSGVLSRGTAAPAGGSDGDLYFQYT